MTYDTDNEGKPLQFRQPSTHVPSKNARWATETEAHFALLGTPLPEAANDPEPFRPLDFVALFRNLRNLDDLQFDD